MIRVRRHKLILVVLAASVAVVAAAVEAGSTTGPTQEARSTESVAVAADTQTLECRGTKAAMNDELEQLRLRCDAALAEFEACRANRPAWSDVELFSCGFDMSTDLARGDLDATASLEACGGTRAQASRMDCPVPSCESELERLEELSALRNCLGA